MAGRLHIWLLPRGSSPTAVSVCSASSPPSPRLSSCKRNAGRGAAGWEGGQRDARPGYLLHLTVVLTCLLSVLSGPEVVSLWDLGACLLAPMDVSRCKGRRPLNQVSLMSASLASRALCLTGVPWSPIWECFSSAPRPSWCFLVVGSCQDTEPLGFVSTSVGDLPSVLPPWSSSPCSSAKTSAVASYVVSCS